MRHSNRGQVLVILAIALFVLMGFAALGIDVGFLYVTRHELQRCADAGALAGASKFAEPSSGWSPNPLDPVMVEAEARARDYASRDTVLTTPLDNAAEVDVTFPSVDRIRVTATRIVPLFFARIFGVTNQTVSATAVAEAAVADTGVKCLKPWGIPIPWDDFSLHTPATDNNLKYDAGETVYSLDSIPDGFKMILKVGEPFNNPNNLNNLDSLQQESGHFFALSPCGDSGGSDYRDRIANPCLDDCSVDEGDGIDLKPGNTVGPTRQGVDELIDLDPNAVYNESTHEVENSAYGDDWMSSPRLVKIPLYDPSELLSQGNTQMHVAAFAGFWLKGYDTTQGTVIGYYISNSVSEASSSSGPAPGPALKTLRLVE